MSVSSCCVVGGEEGKGAAEWLSSAALQIDVSPYLREQNVKSIVMFASLVHRAPRVRCNELFAGLLWCWLVR